MLDHDVLRELADATGGGAWLRELLQTFVETTAAQLRTLHSASASGDLRLLATTAHSGKSASRTVGALALGDALEAIEIAAAGGGSPELLAAGVQRVAEEFEAARAELHVYAAAMRV